MADSPNEAISGRQSAAPIPERRFLPSATIRHRLGLLKWLVPVALLLLVVVYEAGLSRWIHDSLGTTYQFLGEILVYGTVGPILAFTLLDYLGRWLEERETSDLQAQILARARERAQINHTLDDDVLQALFATSALIASLESDPNISPEAVARLREAQQALSQAIQQLHAHLVSQSASKLQESN